MHPAYARKHMELTTKGWFGQTKRIDPEEVMSYSGKVRAGGGSS